MTTTALMTLTDHIVLDPEVSLPATANLAALSIDWRGFQELLRTSPDAATKFPGPEENEDQVAYLHRVWSLLSSRERSMALDLGLQATISMKHFAETGIQVRVWRAYNTGEWTSSTYAEGNFKHWVKMVLTDTLDASPTEASLLARLCEVIKSLELKKHPGLPDDLETCFMRPSYRRWRAVVSKISSSLDNISQGTVDNPEELLDDIDALIDDVNDTTKTTDDLDHIGTTRPQLQPVQFMEQPGRMPGTNERAASITYTDAQRTFLQRKLGKFAQWVLEGEEYDVETFTYVQFKYDVVMDLWQRREWDDPNWTKWEADRKPHKDLVFDSQLVDGEIAYIHYWEAKK